jgi:hypothetical protein
MSARDSSMLNASSCALPSSTCASTCVQAAGHGQSCTVMAPRELLQCAVQAL